MALRRVCLWYRVLLHCTSCVLVVLTSVQLPAWKALRAASSFGASAVKLLLPSAQVTCPCKSRYALQTPTFCICNVVMHLCSHHKSVFNVTMLKHRTLASP